MGTYAPTIEECRSLVRDFLNADAEYRRDLGAFGKDDQRTTHRETIRWRALNNLRGWYSSRFSSEDLKV